MAPLAACTAAAASFVLAAAATALPQLPRTSSMRAANWRLLAAAV
jgi:hypothetical protein